MICYNGDLHTQPNFLNANVPSMVFFFAHLALRTLRFTRHADGGFGSEEEMRQHAERAPTQPIDDEDLPWSAEEELFCVRPVPPEAAARHPAWAVGRNVALVLALVSFAVGALRTSTAAAGATSLQKPPKLIV